MAASDIQNASYTQMGCSRSKILGSSSEVKLLRKPKKKGNKSEGEERK
jgi:hypothetical protein